MQGACKVHAGCKEFADGLVPLRQISGASEYNDWATKKLARNVSLKIKNPLG